MYGKSTQYQNGPIQSPNETQRSMQSNRRAPLIANSSNVSIPGTKSFHIYNTLLFIFTAIQVALYAIQGINSPCSQCKKYFYYFSKLDILWLYGCVHLHIIDTNYFTYLYSLSKRLYVCYPLHGVSTYWKSWCCYYNFCSYSKPYWVLLCRR